MIAALLAALARFISGTSVHWLAPPADAGQRIYFANHSSHLDFVVIWSALPPSIRRRTRPVAGADYWMRGPVKRFLSREVFRAILIERASSEKGGTPSPAAATKSIETIAAEMGDSDSIIVFPEGTRSRDGEVLPFKSGIYHLAKMKPGIELVPVYLANMNRILPKGEFLPVPLLGRALVGPSIRLEPGEEKGAFLARAREALLALRDQ